MVFLCGLLHLLLLAIGSMHLVDVAAYDNSYYDNLSYWGQNSYGATHTDTAYFQQPISYYCQDNAIDAIPVAFVDTFFGTGGMPVLNLANTCNPTDNVTFLGTDLVNCSSLASDIEYCQSQGKIVTISLGGAGGSIGFTDDIQAQTFAQTIWDLFLGGSSTMRPFGSAVLDGVDLDIEGGVSTGYAVFVTEIRSLASEASKQYPHLYPATLEAQAHLQGAPQCPFPDAYLGNAIDQVGFDAIYVQFYNDVCGLQNYYVVSDWDFGVWDIWARQTSPNPNVKIYIGAPASSTAAGTGYMRESFPSFGGVMLWGASQAYANDRYHLAIKEALMATGSSGYTCPHCSAPAYVSGLAYTGSSQVSYGNYVWEADYWTDSTPSGSSSSDWSAISACEGGSVTHTTTMTTATSYTTVKTTSTSISSAASTTTTATGTCSGVGAWQSGIAYTAGDEVTYE
ncbi:glycoside hydrolase [Gyrodon lividus]|nr:glycoside hydrolase [Gyrodon lividus]